MKNIKTTNTLLLIIVIPLVFYILKILSFIFIPLFLSMFIVLLFLPLMRWMKKHGVPRILSILVIVLIIAGILKSGGELIKLISNEIVTADNELFEKVESKLMEFIVRLEGFFGIQRVEGKNVILHYLQKSNIFTNFSSTIDFIGNTLTMTLMTVFFAVLWLGESVNFQKLMNQTILKQRYSSVKVFMRIENDLIKFIIVKFFISLFTGAGFTVACLIFGISFPIFWGLLAFFLNFIQMLGSVVSIIILSLFAFIELDPTATLLLFIIIITGIQVLLGSVLEPVFMGKSFSINVITILIMLMLWGFLWGISGLILAIPITVFLKIIFEQFPGTRVIAILMSGTDKKIILPGTRKNHNAG